MSAGIVSTLFSDFESEIDPASEFFPPTNMRISFLGYLNDLWKFYLHNSTWSSVEIHGGLLPQRRYGYSLSVIDSKIYVFGGKTDPGDRIITFSL